MKILQINSVVNKGSTGRIAEDIGAVIMEISGESYIAYGRGSGQNSLSQLYEIENHFGIFFHGLITRLLDKHGLGSVRSTRKFCQWIQKIQPDVVHLHNIHGYYINYPILFSFLHKADVPVVWTLHDCWSFTGHCAHFESLGCYKWRTGCFHCPALKKYPASIFIDNSCISYNLKRNVFTSLSNLTIVPVSDWLKDYVEESFLSIYPVRRIYNGIDLNIFSPVSSSLREQLCIGKRKILLGVTNVWSHNKGFEAFIQLRQRLPESITIILVGLTENQKKEVPSGIIGVSRTNSTAELAEFYSIADVFVNPTLEDNFPTTNLEALACGTPVVTYKTGGSPEAITAETGMVVEQGNIEKLIEALFSVLEKGKSFYSRSCRDYAEKTFNKYDRFKEYIELYKEMVKRNR